MSKFNPQDKSSSGPMIPPAPAGIHPARIARVIEIGEHDTQYGVKDQLHIFYSLVTQLIEAPDSDFDGKQHMVRTAPLRKSSSDKSSLMKDHINILLPTCSDLGQLLNLPGFVTIAHNEVQSGEQSRTYANIMQVSGVPTGIEVAELDTPMFHFSWDEPDPDVWENHLWDKIREKIQSAKNYEGSAVQDMVLKLEAMKAE
jgi:hypothetical protein